MQKSIPAFLCTGLFITQQFGNYLNIIYIFDIHKPLCYDKNTYTNVLYNSIFLCCYPTFRLRPNTSILAGNPY